MEKYRNLPWKYIESLASKGSVVSFGQDSRIFAENLSSEQFQTIFVDDLAIDQYLQQDAIGANYAILVNWRTSNSLLNNETLIQAICDKYENILFSSSLTEGHWPSYWMRIFEKNQKVISLDPREFFWDSEVMFPSLKQAIFLASSQSLTKNQSRILDIVHPEYFILDKPTPDTKGASFKIRLLDMISYQNRNRIKTILPNFLIHKIRSWIRKHK
jgi:hypothetical protein